MKSPRFIPAHAGNRRRPGLNCCVLTVHPRACGEQMRTSVARLTTVGSSPRMRGTGLPTNTSFRISSVHPRACGEQMRTSVARLTTVGSSPRMRGTGYPQTHRLEYPRFIPAHAGNSARPDPNRTAVPVHPRACGEQAFRFLLSLQYFGSSPRMRGTADSDRHASQQPRFIPAHAGNRLGLRFQTCAHCGSSPRMRGTDRRPFGPGVGYRFIPAHAGNSSDS